MTNEKIALALAEALGKRDDSTITPADIAEDVITALALPPKLHSAVYEAALIMCKKCFNDFCARADKLIADPDADPKELRALSRVLLEHARKLEAWDELEVLSMVEG